MTPTLREGDVVMICRHIFDAACAAARKGASKLPAEDSAWSSRQHPPKRFEREDGTEGAYHFIVACKSCIKRREFDFIEEVWSGGRLHVADMLRSAGGVH